MKGNTLIVHRQFKAFISSSGFLGGGGGGNHLISKEFEMGFFVLIGQGI